MPIIKYVLFMGIWLVSLMVLFSWACDWMTDQNSTIVFLGVGILIADVALLVWGANYIYREARTYLEDQINDK